MHLLYVRNTHNYVSSAGPEIIVLYKFKISQDHKRQGRKEDLA